MATVSVITPVWNEGRMLLDAVNSVLASTFKEIEFIVVDDGSTDAETLETLKALEEGRQVRVLHQANGGLSAARNAGAAVASGDYLLMLDADDRLDPSYLEKTVRVLDQHPEIDICYTAAQFFGLREGPWELPPYSVEQMLVDNVVYATSLYRRRVFEAVGGYDESNRLGCEDYDFYLTCIEKGFSFHRINEPLYFYRIKPVSMTTNMVTDAGRLMTIRFRLYEGHRALFEQHGVSCAEFVIYAARKQGEQQRIMLAAANQNTEDVKKELANAVQSTEDVKKELANAVQSTEAVKKELANAVEQWTLTYRELQRSREQEEELRRQLSGLTERMASTQLCIREMAERLLAIRTSQAAGNAQPEAAGPQDEQAPLGDPAAAVISQQAQCNQLLRSIQALEREQAYADEMAALQQELEAQRNQVQLMTNSLSWRLTRPLRFGKRLVEKIMMK